MTFELNIYGENDKIIKHYETNHIRYGLLLKSIDFAERSQTMTKKDFITSANELVKAIFVGITDEEIANADFDKVLGVCKQIAGMVSEVNTPKN